MLSLYRHANASLSSLALSLLLGAALTAAPRDVEAEGDGNDRARAHRAHDQAHAPLRSRSTDAWLVTRTLGPALPQAHTRCCCARALSQLQLEKPSGTART
eukprot:670367-Rhodomonas_salina.1